MSIESLPHNAGETRGISEVVTAWGELVQGVDPNHEDLELISRVWHGHHKTMYERALSDLVPLAETVTLKTVVPKELYVRKERITWLANAATNWHAGALEVDVNRINTFITHNPGLILVANGSMQPVIGELTQADIVEGKNIREPSKIALFRGKRVAVEKSQHYNLVCSMGLVAKLIAAEQEQA